MDDGSIRTIEKVEGAASQDSGEIVSRGLPTERRTTAEFMIVRMDAPGKSQSELEGKPLIPRRIVVILD